MSKQVPQARDFPPQLNPQVYQSSSAAINAVLFFHGLGDTSPNFARFANALNLPETVCITLQAPHSLPLPAPHGFHWGDDILVDSNTGDVELDSGFEKVFSLMANVSETLSKSGFKAREIMLFGLGQGGMVALAVARKMEDALGGAISIGGPIPCGSMIVNGVKSPTPVLLLGGSNGLLTESAIKSVRASFQTVEVHKWKKAKDSTPQNRDEAMPMMQFFAQHLRSRRGVPEGSIEVG